MDYDAVLSALGELVGRSVIVTVASKRDTVASASGELRSAETSSLLDSVRGAAEDDVSYDALKLEVAPETQFVVNRARFVRGEASGPLLLIFLQGDIVLAIHPSEPAG